MFTVKIPWEKEHKVVILKIEFIVPRRRTRVRFENLGTFQFSNFLAQFYNTIQYSLFNEGDVITQ